MNNFLFSIASLFLPATVSTNWCAFPTHRLTSFNRSGEPSPRPAADRWIASDSLPIIVHYLNATSDTYAQNILRKTEEAWRQYVDVMKFRAPRDDGDNKFDLYIVDSLPTGVGGYSGFSGYYDPSPEADAVGYLVISDKLAEHIQGFVVAHELFHAVQMAYDWWEDLSFMEGSATWAAELAFPNDNIYWRFYPYFNAEPHRALDYLGLQNPYQYGSAMWWNFLDEFFGKRDGKILRQLWENSVQNEWNNEPDYMDALKTVLPGGDFDGAFQNFATWRFLLGSRNDYGFFAERRDWLGNMDPPLIASMLPDTPSIEVSPEHQLVPYSSGYISLKPASEQHKIFTAILQNRGNCKVALRVLQLKKANEMMAIDFNIILPGSSAEINWQTNAASQEEILQLANLGDGQYDPELSSWEECPFTIKVERR